MYGANLTSYIQYIYLSYIQQMFHVFPSLCILLIYLQIATFGFDLVLAAYIVESRHTNTFK